MDYLSGVIDGAILVDGVVRNVLGNTGNTSKFWERYAVEIAHVRNLISQCRRDEVMALLEEGG